MPADVREADPRNPCRSVITLLFVAHTLAQNGPRLSSFFPFRLADSTVALALKIGSEKQLPLLNLAAWCAATCNAMLWSHDIWSPPPFNSAMQLCSILVKPGSRTFLLNAGAIQLYQFSVSEREERNEPQRKGKKKKLFEQGLFACVKLNDHPSSSRIILFFRSGRPTITLPSIDPSML